MIDIAAVVFSQRIAITDGGDVCPITNLLDAYGDECGADQAVAAVARLADGQWVCIDLSQFERVSAH